MIGRLTKAFLPLIFLLVNNFAHAEQQNVPSENGKCLLLGYGGNYPVGYSEELYSPSIYHPIIGLRHISEDWILGISMQFKFLQDKAVGSKLAIWSLQEEFNYKVRVYHPLYLLVGGKTFYLLPVQRGTYPFHQLDNSGPELGIGATTSLLYFFTKHTAVGVYADLWRGTASQEFESLEIGMHLVLPLPL